MKSACIAVSVASTHAAKLIGDIGENTDTDTNGWIGGSAHQMPFRASLVQAPPEQKTFKDSGATPLTSMLDSGFLEGGAGSLNTDVEHIDRNKIENIVSTNFINVETCKTYFLPGG